MFENYVSSKNVTSSRWIVALIVASIAIHVIGVTAIIVRSYWIIEKLPIPGSQAEFATTPPPPPPPPPASKKPPTPKVELKHVVVKVNETVQPEKDKLDPKDVQVIDPDDGVEGGVEGGDPNGVVSNLPPPPPKQEAPTVVPNKVLEANRIAGETQISPPDEVKNQIRRDAKTRITAIMKLCLDATGNVKQVSVMRASGYAAYDRKIQSVMSTWRYKPYQVNGSAVPACSAVTFIYSQTN